ncbi:MAG: hypothetical protein A2Y57_00240 [Candidatus Woykebacteria bacterium RBG_13_40_7b]|uniref:Uncharacterized protein n=1 Tax=Candidatus Woykebacteria bacterium RBG_13_40_7b TaxID=1802594 RepID=A0A1G1WB29_9BACT|nr:MAG: hypothetical protein A2Y57_00240 [Candidatus Woykebacteria bacterium RBG_13_40_7b]
MVLTVFLSLIFISIRIEDLFWKVSLIFAAATFYFGFGLSHHHEEKNLRITTIFEYLGLAALILLAFITLLR